MLMLTYVERQKAKSSKEWPVSWSEDGFSFIISDSQRLVDYLLPKFFRETKFSSFTRKLYRWGFRQTSIRKRGKKNKEQQKMEFGHEYFHRNSKDLITNMKSVTAAGTRRAIVALQNKQDGHGKNENDDSDSDDHLQGGPASTSLGRAQSSSSSASLGLSNVSGMGNLDNTTGYASAQLPSPPETTNAASRFVTSLTPNAAATLPLLGETLSQRHGSMPLIYGRLKSSIGPSEAALISAGTDHRQQQHNSSLSNAIFHHIRNPESGSMAATAHSQTTSLAQQQTAIASALRRTARGNSSHYGDRMPTQTNLLASANASASDQHSLENMLRQQSMGGGFPSVAGLLSNPIGVLPGASLAGHARVASANPINNLSLQSNPEVLHTLALIQAQRQQQFQTQQALMGTVDPLLGTGLRDRVPVGLSPGLVSPSVPQDPARLLSLLMDLQQHARSSSSGPSSNSPSQDADDYFGGL